jgi:hypothetical protein
MHLTWSELYHIMFEIFVQLFHFALEYRVQYIQSYYMKIWSSINFLLNGLVFTSIITLYILNFNIIYFVFWSQFHTWCVRYNFCFRKKRHTQFVNLSCNNNQNLLPPLLLKIIEEISIKILPTFMVATFFAAWYKKANPCWWKANFQLL